MRVALCMQLVPQAHAQPQTIRPKYQEVARLNRCDGHGRTCNDLSRTLGLAGWA